MKSIIKTTKAEGVGENAKGASDKINDASASALEDIAKAGARYANTWHVCITSAV